MPDKICPVCQQPYIKKKEFETAIRYFHPYNKTCDEVRTMPTNPNTSESTPADVLRRKGARKSK